MSGAWRSVARAIREGEAYRTALLNFPGMTRTINSINWGSLWGTIINLHLVYGEILRPIPSPITNNGWITRRAPISRPRSHALTATILTEGLARSNLSNHI